MPRLAVVALAALVTACGGPGPSGTPAATAAPAVSVNPSDATASPAGSLPPATVLPSASPVAVATDAPPACGTPKAYTGSFPNEPLLPVSAVRVSVAELNLRDGPCTAAGKQKTLKKGTLLVLTRDPFGPVKANGYAWYEVMVLPGAPADLPVLPHPWQPQDQIVDFGWIAATDGLHDYVTPVSPRCPTTVDTEHVEAMFPAEWLWCFDSP